MGAPRFNAAFLRTAQGYPYLLAPLIPVAVVLDLTGVSAIVVFAWSIERKAALQPQSAGSDGQTVLPS